MKFNILSINDDRKAYKDQIRSRVLFEEVRIPTVNAYEVDVEDELKKRGLWIAYPGMFSRGEIGVWLSTYDCWQWASDNEEELVVFEDDAIPSPSFETQLRDLTIELPSDYDFLTLWVPENQIVDYTYDVVYDDEGQPTHVGPNKNSITSIYNFGSVRLARVYNGYGNVAQLYSPKGGWTLAERVRSTGIYTPVDCFLYQEAHAGRCDGYGPKPNRATLVSYDWAAETTVHLEDRL